MYYNNVTLPSARASGAPARCGCRGRRRRDGGRSPGRGRARSGCRTGAGSRLRAPGSSISVAPAGMSRPPTFVRTLAIRNCARNGLSSRSVSSMKFGMRSRSSRSRCWRSGRSPSMLQRERQQPDRGLPAAGEQVGGDQRDVVDLGRRPVGERRGGQPVMMSSRGSRRRSSM